MKCFGIQVDKSVVCFIAKFFLYFGLFYGGSHVIVGMATKPGYYSAWVENNFDLITDYRKLLLHLSGQMIAAFNYKYIIQGFRLDIIDGFGVHLAVSCAGVGLLSFWWAFVLAFPEKVIRKVWYFIVGTATIVFLNVIRISTLVIVYTEYGRSDIDHHLLFNLAVYVVLFLMIIKWVNNPEKSTNNALRKNR